MWNKLKQLFNRERVSRGRVGAQGKRTAANPLYALGLEAPVPRLDRPAARFAIALDRRVCA